MYPNIICNSVSEHGVGIWFNKSTEVKPLPCSLCGHVVFDDHEVVIVIGTPLFVWVQTFGESVKRVLTQQRAPKKP